MAGEQTVAAEEAVAAEETVAVVGCGVQDQIRSYQIRSDQISWVLGPGCTQAGCGIRTCA